MNTDRRIARVLSEVLNVPEAEISGGFSRNDAAQWTSLAHLTVILALEEEFQVRFTDAEAVELSSVSLIHSALASRGIS